jgi:hypothetical protein
VLQPQHVVVGNRLDSLAEPRALFNEAPHEWRDIVRPLA